MEKFGFVYIWRDVKRSMYYIGSHWGTEDDGYICSSNRMLDAYRRRPNDFKRRVIAKIFTNREELLDEEHKLLELIEDNELGNKYYNLRKHRFGHWCADYEQRKSISEKLRDANTGKKHSDETKRKMSDAHVGAKNAFHGKKHSEESKRKMKLSQSKRTDDRSISEKTRQKLRDANTGKKHSEESKRKMSISRKGSRRISDETLDVIKTLYINGTPKRQIARDLKISRETVKKYIKNCR